MQIAKHMHVKNKQHLLLLFVSFITSLLLFTYLYFESTNKNHMKQQVVTNNAQAVILTQFHTCQTMSNKSLCLKNAAQTFLKQFPLNTVLATIEHNEKDTDVFNNCHELTHYLGREQFHETKDVGKTLSQCSYACFSGCMHGALEGYFIEKDIPLDSSEALVRNEVGSICGKQQDYEQPELFSQCLHGIGHAMMFITQADLPRSLTLCDALPESRQQNLCYSGVFMENSTSSTNKDHPSQFRKADDPMYPCTILDQRYQSMCYQLQAMTFYEHTGYDLQKTFALCEQVPQIHRTTCYKTLGSQQVGYTQDATVIKERCELVPEDAKRQACIFGVITAMSTRFGSDITRMNNFCSVVNTTDKELCYRTVGISLQKWSNNTTEALELCKKIEEPQQREWCNELSLGDAALLSQ